MPATATITGPTVVGSITETVIDIDLSDYITDSQTNGPHVTPSVYSNPNLFASLPANPFGPGQGFDKMNRASWANANSLGILRRPILTNGNWYHVFTWANVTSASYYYPNTSATWEVIIVRAKAYQLSSVEDGYHALEDMYVEIPQNAKDEISAFGVPDWAIPDYFSPRTGWVYSGYLNASNNTSSYGGRGVRAMTGVASWDSTERRICLDSSHESYYGNRHVMRFTDGKCTVQKYTGGSWYKAWTDWTDGPTMVKDQIYQFTTDDDIIPTCFNTTMTLQAFANPNYNASVTLTITEYDFQFSALRTQTLTPTVTPTFPAGYYYISPQDFSFTVGSDCRYIRVTSSDSYVFFFIKELPIAYIRNGQPTLTRGRLAATPLVALPYCVEARNGDLILGRIPRS